MIKQITRKVLLPSALCAALLSGFASIASASMVWLTDLNAEVTSGRVESLVADFAAAERAGLDYGLLPESFDVDTAADLERLRDEIAEREFAGEPGPRNTTAALGRMREARS